MNIYEVDATVTMTADNAETAEALALEKLEEAGFTDTTIVAVIPAPENV